MPTFYNFTQDGYTYSFDDVFVPADLFRQGNLWTWGAAANGVLGTNDTTQRSTPVTTFAGGTNWKQISCGGYHTAAIKTDGTLWIWGRASNGVLGTNDTTPSRSTPVTTFAGGTNWKEVSAGGRVTLAIKTDGTLWSWGNYADTGIGYSVAPFRVTPVTTFAGGNNWADTPTTNPEDLYTLSAGGQSSVAIKTDGTLWVWGSNTSANLGTNDATVRSTAVTTFAGGTDWKQISCSFSFTAAIKTDGTLWVWGSGSNGTLGINNTLVRSTPVTTFAGGTNWRQVSTSNNNTAAIKTDGTLWTWGYNSQGQLGTNDLTTRLTPVTTFAGGTDWKQVSSGILFTAAIKTDGTLWTWGYATYGRLGTNDTIRRLTPVTTFAGGTNWKQVTCSQFFAGAIKTDGTLWTWGRNNLAQLGTNDIIQRLTPVTTFAGGTNWKQISSCLQSNSVGAVKTDGTLWTWGSNQYGQLGINNTFNRSTPVTTFAGGTNWKQVSSGSSHMLALSDDGVNKLLYVFGSDSAGSSTQFLGINFNPTITWIPSQLPGTNWKTIGTITKTPFTGGSPISSQAIKTDGTLWTWGTNTNGQLGTNDTFTRLTPVTTFAGGTNWKQACNTGVAMFAIKTDGTLWTCGNGLSLGLGYSRTPFRVTPVTTFAGGNNWADTPTTNPEDLYTFSAGNNYSTAIKTDGTLWVWGRNLFLQLGTNDNIDRSTPVTTFAGGTDWKQVSCTAGSSTAAIKTDGTLWTWGAAGNGLLGTNDTINRFTPVTTFAGGTNWKQVSSGGGTFSAIKTDGTLWSWGAGNNGRLGTNDTINRFTPVTTFAGGTDWKQVSSGVNVAAIKTDGTLWVWGAGTNGALGTNDTIQRLTPVTTFAGGTNWKQVSCGNSYTAAIKTDGTLWTWGYGGSGRLGNNDTTNRSTPVTTFSGGTDWKQVSCGTNHMAAIKTDGTLWVWGSGSNGILGTNDLTSRSTPVTTFAGGTNWKQVSAGSHTIALSDDGVNKLLYVFGNDSSQQLGTNFDPAINWVPSQLPGTNWKQVDTGASINAQASTFAIKTDGTLWTWGINNAQLGTNDIIFRYTPTTTFVGGTNWKQVSSGGANVSAIKTDGTLWTWGNNTSRVLGTNDTISRSTPVTTFAGGTNWKQVSCNSGVFSNGSFMAALTYDDPVI